MGPGTTTLSLKGATEGSLLPVQQHISVELDALERRELRSEAQVKALMGLLGDATVEQRKRAELLQVTLLADGRPLDRLPKLGIVVEANADGTKDISYYKVMNPEPPLSLEELNPTSKDSRLLSGELPMQLLGTVRDARSVSPRIPAIISMPEDYGERILELIGEQSRVTFHHGIPITWDKNIDAKAWSTNIDTVYFSDWLREAGVFNSGVRSSLEIGCGAGGISQAVVASCPHLERHIFTDIDPNAINATRRNLRPLHGTTHVTWAIGKGLKGLVPPGSLDIIVTNPPYIPHPDGDGDKDHYSGTKLIRRLFEDGIPLLNPHNPDAAIYVQMSSVTLPDFERYQREFPNVEVTPIGTPVRVPLRVSGLLEEERVLNFIEMQGGLEIVPGDRLKYYHEIMAFRLKPKK